MQKLLEKINKAIERLKQYYYHYKCCPVWKELHEEYEKKRNEK